MIKYHIDIQVDQFADDDVYELFEARLRCIGDNIYAEPVVDIVMIQKEEVIGNE